MKYLLQFKALYLVVFIGFFSTQIRANLRDKVILPKSKPTFNAISFKETRLKTVKRNLVIIPPDLLAFFVQKNYRFMTKALNRPPTLYFEDEQGNMGRIRQGHGQGKSLVFATANIHPHRVFFSQELVSAFQQNPNDGPDWVEAASLFPAIGEKVFEFFGDWNPLTNHYENDHGSSGNIVKIGGRMPNFNINQYEQFVVRW